MNLTKQNWPLGYTPSEDAVNGNPNGLMRMDNCYLDELGVLSLTQGIQRLNASAFSTFPYQIYSKILAGNKEAIWASLGLSSTQIIRSAKGDFSDTTVIGSGTDKGAFGDCLGEVIVFAGSTRLKDSSSVVQNLGLQVPGLPAVTNISQPQKNLTGVYTVPVGTLNSSSSDGAYILLTSGNTQGIILDTLSGPTDTTLIAGGASDNPLNDTISFQIIPDDPTVITLIRLEFIVDANNVWSYEFDPSTLSQGPQQMTTLATSRGSFTRPGGIFKQIALGEAFFNPITHQVTSLPVITDWTKITAIRFTIQANSQINVTCQHVTVNGGVQGTLNGTYSYIQVNVNDNGFYQAKSPPSLATSQVTIVNGEAVITPAAAEAQVNQCWIYRFGGNLDQYYRVGITTPGTPITDNNSDATLLEINLPLNPFLVTVQRNGLLSGLNDTIYCVEGLFYNRMLYMGLGFIYISDTLNPDAIDSRYTIKAFGDPSEKNLWIKKLTNNVCMLGTTKNLYELTGTFQPLPDGTLDVSINPIGENHPPITFNACSSAGVIFYMAADGVRATAGSNSTLLGASEYVSSGGTSRVSTPQQLRLFFNGETRGDVPPFVISQFADYPMTVGKNRFMVSIPSVDGTQRLFIYDLINNYWRFQFTDPISLFTTQTNRVLLGYNQFAGSTGGDIYLLDSGLGFTDNSGNQISGFPLEIRTFFDANGQPRNRKDTFTLKLIVDTGGVGCSVYIAKDKEGSPYQFVGSFNTSGLTTVYFPLNNFTLGFRYSIRIVDNGTIINNIYSSALLTFKLYEMTIEYDPRPEQLDYMVIQPSNLGTASRKRIVNYAFVIDTLGNNITFTPLIDNSNTGVLPTSRVFSTPLKQTYIYYFTQEQIGTDINGILSGGVFEFYGLNDQEIVSEKMPVPCEYLVIPNNDYGTPDRKRHSSYKFQINTRGSNVTFTPKLDGNLLAPAIYNTTEKRVVEYFFQSDTIAIEVGGTLVAIDGHPFEFYGVVTPELIEKLPPRLEYYRIPNENFGVAARKRIRTLPFVIDTYGQPVTFQPIVDGVIFPGVSYTTTGKTTQLYYFTSDTFGIDYGGQVISQTSQPFEFYGLGTPENVETLPVGKTYDQLGPIRFDKIGKIFSIRLRLIDTGNGSIPVNLYGDADTTDPFYDVGNLFSTTITPKNLIDYVYQIDLPKSVNSDILRLALGNCTFPFHRFDCYFKVSTSGMESDSKWIPVK